MNHEKWERLSYMTLMIIKRGILEEFRGVVSEEITKAKEFIVKIETSVLLLLLITMNIKTNVM